MPPPRPVPEALTGQAFTRTRGLQLVTAGRLRGPAFRRLHRGVHASAGHDLGVAERIQAARLALPHDAVLAGVSAAVAHGLIDDRDAGPVTVICPAHRLRPRPGIVVRSERLRPDEIVQTALGPATSPGRTALDLARSAALPTPAARALLRRLSRPASLLPEAPRGAAAFGFPVGSELGGESPSVLARRLLGAVARVDALLRQTSRPVGDLATSIQANARVRGLLSAHVVMALADPRAESIPESVLRCRFVLAGLPAPEPQYEIWNAGRFVARPDMSWLRLELSAEYDGIYHDEGQAQPSKDRARDVEAHGAGWELLHYEPVPYA